MKGIPFILICLLVVLDIALFGWILNHFVHFQLLDPAGIVASREKTLLVSVFFLGITIIGSVIATTFFIVWRYREGNPNSTYTPEVKGSRNILLLYWIFPSLIIIFLAFITWKSTHALDPYKPLQSSEKPLKIQVVALQWKWLFIYPEEHIATVNFLEFPEKTPITFELTADAPMNSFWIPQLGGQMYAMTGMVTTLHLMADKIGEFKGSSAEISGAGYAGMRFIAKATSEEDYKDWVATVKKSDQGLDKETYDALSKPSEDVKPQAYASVGSNLYNEIVTKYMPHTYSVMQGMSERH